MSQVCKKIEDHDEMDSDDEKTAEVSLSSSLFFLHLILCIFEYSVHKKVETNVNVARLM
jgi:hypothetical protein